MWGGFQIRTIPPQGFRVVYPQHLDFLANLLSVIRFGIDIQRTWKLEEKKGTKILGTTRSITASLGEIFLCAGWLFSPASQSSIWSIFSSAFRWMEFVDRRYSDLRLTSQVEGFGPRHKALFAEELAIGCNGLVLQRLLQVQHIADAFDLQQCLTNTGRKLPDWICISENREGRLIESKGAMRSSGTTAQQIRKGKMQLKNVNLSTVMSAQNAPKLVLATEFCSAPDPDTHMTRTILCDPPADKELNESDLLLVIRKSYAKALNLMGFHSLALETMNERSWSIQRENNLKGYEGLFPAIEMPNIGILGLQASVGESLANGKVPQGIDKLRSTESKEIMLANGLTFIPV
jgi:hypothetical protein